MKLGTPNPNRHWHQWEPLDNNTRTDKRCQCGAVKYWNGRRWIVRKAK